MIKTFFNKFIALFLALNLLSGVTFAQLGPLGTIPTYNANNVNKNGNIFESTQDYLEQKRVEVLKKEIQDSLPTFQEALPEIQKAIREDFKLKKNAKVDSKVAKAYYEYLITSIAQDYQQAVKVANHLASFGDGNTTNPGTRQIGLNIPKQYAFIIGQLETVKNVKENDLSTATLNIKGLGVVSVKNFIQGSVRAILNKELGSLSKAKALGALGLFNQLVDKGGLLESDVARAVQYLKYAIDGSAEYCDRSQSYCANIGAAMTLLGVLTPKGQKYASQEVIYNTLVKAHREGYKYEAMLLEPAIAALISLKTGEAYKRIEEFVLVEIAPQGDGWKKFKKVTGELFELISINAWASRFIQNGEVDSTFGGKYLDYISQRYQIVDEAYAKYIGGITKEDFTNSSKAFKIPYRNILENIGFMIATTGTENGNQLAYKILEKYVQLDAARRKQMVPQTENKPIYIGGGPMSMGGVSALPDNARHIDPSAHMNVPLVAGILQSEKLPPNQDMRTAAQLFNTYDWWDINAVTQHRLNNIPNGNKNLKTQARIYGIPSRKKDYTSAGGGLVRLDKEDYTTTQRYLANERLLRKTMFVDMVIGAVFLTQLVVSAPRIVVSVAKAGQAISKLTPVYANNAARIVRLTFNGKGSLYRTLRANSVNINKYMFADARVAKYRAQKLATQKNKAIKNETKVKGNPKASITKIAVAENETLLAKTKFRQAQFDYVIERLIDPATKAKIKFQAAKISKWKIKRQSSSVGGESSILSEDAKVYLSLKNQAQVNVDFANISLKQAKKGYGLEGFTREGQPIFAPLPKVEFTKWIDPNIPSFATKATNIIKTQTANLFNNIQGFPAKTADIFKTNAVSFFAQTGKIRQSFASLLLKQITKPLPSAKVAGAVKQTTSFNQLMIPIEKSIEKLQGNITKIIENFVKGKAGKTVILSSFGFGELNNWLNRSQSIKDYKEYVQKAINTARTKIWEDLINNNFSTKHMGSSFVEYLSEAMKKDERIPLDLRKEILSNFRTMLVAEMRIHVNPRQVLSDINYEKSSRVDLDNPMLSNLEYFAESKDYNIRVRKLLSVFSKKNKEVKYVSENFENIIFKASSDALDLTKKRLGEVNEETRLFRETLVVSFGKTISSQLSKLGDDSIISLITGKT
ncbi:MAG: hypothetical protein LBM71_05215, partial [Elusimicrobiota bacterium]|nr:hypothetical protein [Elusimicrobiota bacterium]